MQHSPSIQQKRRRIGDDLIREGRDFEPGAIAYFVNQAKGSVEAAEFCRGSAPLVRRHRREVRAMLLAAHGKRLPDGRYVVPITGEVVPRRCLLADRARRMVGGFLMDEHGVFNCKEIPS